jgi:desulfoferrodoxin (superoxide reductase-like protein)
MIWQEIILSVGTPMKRMGKVLVLTLLVFCWSVGVATANQSSVTIEAPQSVQKGVELTIRVTVTHSANTSLHYTEWLKVTVNQKDVARWDYTGNDRPEAAVFTKEIKLKATENMEITAQASCNIHGSNDPATVKVTVRE